MERGPLSKPSSPESHEVQVLGRACNEMRLRGLNYRMFDASPALPVFTLQKQGTRLGALKCVGISVTNLEIEGLTDRANMNGVLSLLLSREDSGKYLICVLGLSPEW